MTIEELLTFAFQIQFARRQLFRRSNRNRSKECTEQKTFKTISACQPASFPQLNCGCKIRYNNNIMKSYVHSTVWMVRTNSILQEHQRRKKHCSPYSMAHQPVFYFPRKSRDCPELWGRKEFSNSQNQVSASLVSQNRPYPRSRQSPWGQCVSLFNQYGRAGPLAVTYTFFDLYIKLATYPTNQQSRCNLYNMSASTTSIDSKYQRLCRVSRQDFRVQPSSRQDETLN